MRHVQQDTSRTTAPTTWTEPLRIEHRQLLHDLDALDAAAEEAERWDRAEAASVLAGVLSFLRDDLVSHAGAEEQVLYPAFEAATAAPGSTATMRADHAEIVVRIYRLGATVDTIVDRWPEPALARDIERQLVALSAIIRLHFQKEEEVLLPALDSVLDERSARRLFVRMRRVARP